MGAAFNLKDMVLENRGIRKPNESLWSKVLEAHRQSKRKLMRIKKKRILMKRRAIRDGSKKKLVDGIEKRVRTLKKLIPNTESETLEGLFRDTADYIISLHIRVGIMQIMVNALS
ncbi:hypothetical protein Ancab_022516, partial [Ancistrocladus abbreviatus]